MRRFNSLSAFLLSFYSPDLYRDAGRSWRGAGLLYLMLAVGLCIAPRLVKFQLRISHFTSGEGTQLVDQLPHVSIRNGQATVDVATPYVIREPRTGAELAIIDTSGTITSLDGRKARVLLTRTSVMIRKNPAETRMFDLARVQRFDFGREDARGALAKFTRWFVLLLSPFAIACSFLYRAIQVVAFALLGLLLARALRAPLDFGAVMRVTAVASTPMMILDALLGLAGIHVPMWWLACQLLVIAYLIFGIKANVNDGAPPSGFDALVQGQQ